MNLWLRLAWYFLTSGLRPRLAPPDAVSKLAFRVLPFDLDLMAHMNNGRYLTLMDVGRLDYMVRTGLWSAALRHRWTPVATAIAVRYRRELRLLDHFRLETRLIYWDATAVVMEQLFVFERGPRSGEIAARALFRGGLYDREARKFVGIARLMSELGVFAESPPPNTDVDVFLKTGEALRPDKSTT